MKKRGGKLRRECEGTKRKETRRVQGMECQVPCTASQCERTRQKVESTVCSVRGRILRQ